MSRACRPTADPLGVVGQVRDCSGACSGWILWLSCGRPLLRWRFPSTTLSQTVQTFGFEAVLALAWLPHMLGEGAAG